MRHVFASRALTQPARRRRRPSATRTRSARRARRSPPSCRAACGGTGTARRRRDRRPRLGDVEPAHTAAPATDVTVRSRLATIRRCTPECCATRSSRGHDVATSRSLRPPRGPSAGLGPRRRGRTPVDRRRSPRTHVDASHVLRVGGRRSSPPARGRPATRSRCGRRRSRRLRSRNEGTPCRRKSRPAPTREEGRRRARGRPAAYPVARPRPRSPAPARSDRQSTTITTTRHVVSSASARTSAGPGVRRPRPKRPAGITARDGRPTGPQRRTIASGLAGDGLAAGRSLTGRRRGPQPKNVSASS